MRLGIKAYREVQGGEIRRLFPFWDGTREGKKIATRDLVQVFGRASAFAGVEVRKERDLRREACCRWGDAGANQMVNALGPA